MKTRGTSVRFVLVSATVPNIDDIAAWIGGGPSREPATVFKVPPCLVALIVLSFNILALSIVWGGIPALQIDTCRLWLPTQKPKRFCLQPNT